MLRKNAAKLSIAVAASMLASVAFGATESGGLLRDVTARFLSEASYWAGTITTYATWLFWVLVVISMVWTFGMLALRKADIGEFFAEFIRFSVTTGFFLWVLTNGPAMAVSIINSMMQIGSSAATAAATGTGSGEMPGLSPSTPIGLGLDIVKKSLAVISFNPLYNAGIVLIALAILVCMAVVSANVLIALVTAWVLAYAGIFILGFGGSRWTSEMAIGYFKAVLGIGLELMTMTLLVGIATSVVNGFYQNLDASSLYELMLVFCVCAVLALLIGKIPGRVAALSGGGSGASIGAGSVMGAAAMAGAAVASGGAALAAAGASAAGGAQALMAAYKAASAAEGAAGGGASAILSAAGGAGGGSGDSGGGGALANAMGDVGGAGGSAASGGGGASGRTGVAGPSAGGPEDGMAASAAAPSAQAEGKSAGAGASDAKGAQAVNATGGGGSIAAKAGRIAAGTVGTLARGSWDVAKAKGSEVIATAMDRIGETTGGKIATAIEARADAVATAAADTASFGGDNIGAAGTPGADAEAEIAAFRDRKAQS